jgi:hypothetical protein
MIAFDIEIRDEFELRPGEDLDARGPFRISVAAIHDAESGRTRVWHDRDASGEPAGHLDPALARAVLEQLRAWQLQGKRIVAWNGLSFDLRWMGEAANDLRLAREVALDLIDPMFQFYCLKGFPVGLQAVATGLDLPVRKLMDGKDAPAAWNRGERRRVIEYVEEDCRITTLVCSTIEKRRAIIWRTSKGSLSEQRMPKLLPVSACLELPEPDTSWMNAPIPRSKFAGWLAAS